MFTSIKIKITDEVHLRAVCRVLETMGYVKSRVGSVHNYIYAMGDGSYYIDMNYQPAFNDVPYSTLTDLLLMRDKLVKYLIGTKA